MKFFIAATPATDGSGGFATSDAQYMLDIANNIKDDPILYNFLSEYYDKISQNSIFIISQNLGPSDLQKNAFYVGEYRLSDYDPLTASYGGYSFYTENNNGSILNSSTFVIQNTKEYQTINIQKETFLSAENGGSVASAANPDGNTFGLSLNRILFHELSHGLMDYSYNNSNFFGSDDNKDGSSSLNYAGAEALAVAAENYVYAKSRHQPSRIGHSSYKVGAKIERSFDPALPFENVSSVSYKQLTSGNLTIGDFYGTVDGTDIHVDKKYYQAHVIFHLTSARPSSGAQERHPTVNNYITVSAEGSGILNSSGGVSQAFKDVVRGIAAPSLSVINSDTKAVSANSAFFSKLNASLDGTGIQNFEPILPSFRVDMIKGVMGLSNERFTDGSLVDYVGPRDAFSTNTPASDLFLKGDANTPSVLIGGAGFNDVKAQKNPLVNGETQPFAGAEDIIQGSAAGHNIIIAGNNTGGNANTLIGGGDGDAIFGGEGNDRIFAGNGAEMVFASTGHDKVWGNNQTIFVVAESMGAVTIAPQATENGYKVSIGGGTTTLNNVHIFMGNSHLTTFKSVSADGSVYIAGSGGGIFYLKDGDTAIGNKTGTNTYYLSTTVSNGEAPKINILNFGDNDRIYIQKPGTAGDSPSDYKLFTGYSAKTESVSLIDHALNPPDTSIGNVVTSRKGTSSGWSIDYPENYNLSLDPEIYHDVFGKYPPSGAVSDVSYSKISSNAGTLSFYKTDGSGALQSGLDLNISSADSNLGSSSNLKIQDSLSYLGTAYTDYANPDHAGKGLNFIDYWDRTYAFGRKTLTPSSAGWPYGGDSSAFQNLSLVNITNIVATRSPEIQAFSGLPAAPAHAPSSSSPHVLNGTSGSDALDPAGTYDTVVGGGGGDTFVYNPGYGTVAIEEADTAASPSNTLQLGSGITPSSVSVSAYLDGSVALDFGNDDKVILSNALLSGNGITYGVQNIAFQDGTVWHYADVLGKLQTTTDSHGAIFGDSGANVLDGHGLVAGAVGNGGGDTFIFNRGYGAMSIYETDLSATPDNILSLGTGITKENIVVTADDNGNIYLDCGDGDVITLIGTLNSANGKTLGVQHIQFADGTSWSYSDILARVATVSDAAATLYGDGGAQTFNSAGIANTILGGGGGDTIVYEQGYGELTLDEVDTGTAPGNTLQLGGGITVSGTTVSANAQGDIVLDFGNGDSITLTNALNSGSGKTYGVQSVQFVDGTVWHYADLLAALATPSVARTTLYGDTHANVLDGAGLARTLIGGGGGDTFIYNQGYGALTITEADASSSPDNSLHLGAGLSASSLAVSGNSNGDLILTFGAGDTITLSKGLVDGGATTYGIQHVVFANGTTLTYGDLLTLALTPTASHTVLYGDGHANTLDGLGIAKTLIGAGGGDTLVYMKGYGLLTIDEADTTATPDNVLVIGSELSAHDLTVTADANGNLILNFGGGDQITLVNALNSTNITTYGVQSVHFADGSSLSYQQLLALADTPSSSNTTLYGDTGANTLDGLGIAHTLVGNGGGDTFVFNQGYGTLTISETDPSIGDTNILQLGTGLTAAGCHVSADASGNLILDFGSGDIVTVAGALKAGLQTSNGVQQVNFADGTSWTYAQMIALADTGAVDNTVLYGDGQGDTFDPRGFAHVINSSGGGDTIIYDQGYGSLTINETDASGYAANVIQMGPGITQGSLRVTTDAAGDMILSLGGSDQIVIANALNNFDGSSVVHGLQQINFADGSSLTYEQLLALADTPSATNVTLFGDGRAQIFDPQGLAHTVVGRGGGDTIVYKAGYGALLIDEGDTNVDALNVLQFGADIAPQDVAVSRNANGDILLTLSGADQITLANQLATSANMTSGIQQVLFANGASWSAADLVRFSSASIVVSPGSGLTLIDEENAPAGVQLPVIDFQTVPSDVVVTMGDDLNSLLLSSSNGSSVEIADIHNARLADRQLVRFSDGTIWHLSNVLGQISNTASLIGPVKGVRADEIFDFSSTPMDVTGTKTINGGGGNDLFRYNIGDGLASVDQTSLDVSAVSTLAFGTGITRSMLTVTAAHGNLVIAVNGSSTDQITIDNALLGNGARETGIQQFTFSDGTSLTYAQVLALAGTAGAGSDRLEGDENANVLDPAGYASTVAGRGGGDTILYNSGYGNLVIDEHDDSTAPANTLVLGAGINPSQVTVQAVRNPTVYNGRLDSLQLTVAGSGTITLAGALGDAAAGVQLVRFANGTEWNYSQMIAKLGTTYPYFSPYNGNPVLVGGAFADTLDTHGIAHVVEGNGGGDTIVYKRGYGALQINEIDQGPNVNTLAFGSGISPTDVTVTMNDLGQFTLSLGNGDVVSFTGSGGGKASGYIPNTYQSYTNAYTGVEAVSFADGTVWTVDQLVARQVPSSSGTLYGDYGASVFDPSGGASTITSAGTNDQIIYKIGYGALTIEERPGAAVTNNTLVFGPGITASMLAVTSDGYNLYISLGGGDDITITGELDHGPASTGGIQQFAFADGSRLSYKEMLALANTPSTSNTTLYGDAYAQTFDPRGIASEVYGGGGADTIIYKQGYGALTVNNFGPGTGATLKLGAGLSPKNLTLSSDGSDVILSFGATDTITLSDEISGNGVDWITFGDGTVWSRAKLLANLNPAGPGGPPVIASGTTAAGAYTELAGATGSSSVGSASGTIHFTDTSTTPSDTATITGVSASGSISGLRDNAALLTLLSLGSVSEPSGGNAGSVSWNFATADSAFDYLAAGETVTLTYAVQIANPSGSVTQNITVTITGSNDAPSVVSSGTTVTGAVAEQAGLTGATTPDTASGGIAFVDADLTDTHTASITGVTTSGNTAGLPANSALLSMLSLSTLVEQAGTTPGALGWTFSAADKTFDYLSAGQTVTLTYVVAVNDGHGGVTNQNVTVTITGTNDAPVLATGSTTAASVTELAGTTGSSANDTASGVIKFTDPDLADTHTMTVTAVSTTGVMGGLPGNTTVLGWLSSGALTEPSGATAGSQAWIFAAPDSAFDYLAAGQIATLTYTVTITDSSGASMNQTVAITVTGTNDAPVISVPTSPQARSSSTSRLSGVSISDADPGATETVTIQTVAGTIASTATGGATVSGSASKTMTISGTLAAVNATLATLAYTAGTASDTLTISASDGTASSTNTLSLSVASSVNHDPVVLASSNVAAAISERASTSGATTADTASGAIVFTDDDLADKHTLKVLSETSDGNVSYLPSGTTVQAWLKAGTVTEQVGTTSGSAAWSFSAPDKTFDYLAVGETVTLNYVLQLADARGASVNQNVVVTVTGTNDAPVVATGSNTSASVASQANPNAVDVAYGTLRFTDPDQSDTHTFSTTGVTLTGTSTGLTGVATSTLLSWLQFGGVNEESYGIAGSVGVTFNGPDSYFGYLAAGQSVTLTYVVKNTDNNGASVNQNYAVTVTGTNQAPTYAVSGSNVAASLAEQANLTGSSTADSATGVIRFADPNLTDTHTFKVVAVTGDGYISGLPSDATVLAWLKAGAVTEPTMTTPGSAAWTFSAPDSAFDYLAVGQAFTLTYTVQLTDKAGANFQQNIVLTVTGANDAPVIASGSQTSVTLTRGATTPGAESLDVYAGVLRFTDPEQSDTHTVTVTGVTLSGASAGLSSVDTSTILSWLQIGGVNEESGTIAASVGANFSAADKYFSYLSAGQSVTLNYTVKVTDNNGAFYTQAFAVTANGVNYAPTAINHSGYTTDNWTALTITGASLVAGATDANAADTLTLSGVSGAVGGTVTLTGGNAVFTPTATTLGTASFTYTISDGHGGTSSATAYVATTLHQINGTSGNDTLSGSTKAAQIDGGAGNDTLKAGSAGDTLIGGAGNDTMTGGAGIDTFVFHAGFGIDTISSFTATGASHDVLQFDQSLFADWAHLLGATVQSGSDLLITLDANDTITLKNVALANFTSADAAFV